MPLTVFNHPPNNFIMQTRRTFFKNSAAVVAGVSLASGAQLLAGCSRNDTIRLGFIGVKGMGFSNVSEFIKHPDVEVAAMCDVDATVLENRTNDVLKMHKQLYDKSDGNYKVPVIKKYTDFRHVLDDKDIDAVVISTPDHWHLLITAYACEAGKDVYVEKPIVNSIGECFIMEKVAKRYNRVIQVGQWQRSDTHWQSAIDYVHSGQMGKVRKVNAWAYMDWINPKPGSIQPVPQGVDYDMWLGPAPKVDFNPARFHFNFRWWWDYAGGLMTDWGVHLLDYAIAGMKAGVPKSVMALGGRFATEEGSMQTPDTCTTIYEYDDFIMQWEHAVGIGLGPYNREHGVAFIGDNGTLVVDRGGWKLTQEKAGKKAGIQALDYQKGDGKGHVNHVRNFLDCIKSGKTPNASVAIGTNVALASHMGNVAYRTQSKLFWNDQTRQFIDNDAANQLIMPSYRSPWSLPNV